MRTFFAPLLLALLPLTAQSQTFVHPGVLLDASSLQKTRDEIAAGVPHKVQALAAVRAHALAAPGYLATPFAKVECGSYDKPSIGCREERDDAKAAYTHALLWAYLGEEVHARKAVQIMDAWATTLTGGHGKANAPLQASWAAQMWTRAAEIMRHTSAIWPAADAQRFGTWLLQQYLPDIQRMGPCPGGNWHASAIEARMNIGVYTDRRDIYDKAVADWKAYLPAYVYVPMDGAAPRPRPGCSIPVKELWYDQVTMAAGLSQETCRDLEHTAYGVSAFLNAAETNRLQGGMLYREEEERLVATMEFHTEMQARKDVPAWLCKGKLVKSIEGTMDLGHGLYAGRSGVALPHTSAWLRDNRPSLGNFHYLWETLTHGVALDQ